MSVTDKFAELTDLIDEMFDCEEGRNHLENLAMYIISNLDEINNSDDEEEQEEDPERIVIDEDNYVFYVDGEWTFRYKVGNMKTGEHAFRWFASSEKALAALKDKMAN